MNQRQANLLEQIIESYLKTAQAVSSKYLSEERHLDLSTATIRNEMAILEAEGYIYQPHTSAGRRPTIQGLQYYLDHMLHPLRLGNDELRRLKNVFELDGIKGIAKESAAYSKSACIVAYDNTDFYYTGFSQLFSQPEFNNASLIQMISTAIDHLETVLPRFIDDNIGAEPRIYIGAANPLGQDCAAIFIANNRSRKTIMGLLSPLTTNYKKSVSLLKTVSQYL